MNNLLSEANELPSFSTIRAEQVEPAIRELLAQHRAQLQTLLQNDSPTWDTVVAPLEAMHHRLARTWSPIGHLNGVMNNDALRAAYNACLPLLTAWNADLGQNERLYAAYETILKNEGAHLSIAQRTLLANALRDFRLAGVALPADKKARFKTLTEQLATLSAKFDENVLDAGNSWSHRVTDADELQGLPEPILARAHAAAVEKQQIGWLFTLDAPNYQAVMMHAAHEPLRHIFYRAWVTRASDQATLDLASNGVASNGYPSDANRWDNSALIEQILALRHELAQLVGFANFAEYSLATKMAKSVTEVSEFLQRMSAHSKPAAVREYHELETLAGRALNAWDVAYYGEQLKRRRFDLSEEALRPYFPAPRVLQGMFAVAEKLYRIRIVERHDVDVYHEDVKFFDLLDINGERRGGFFVDLYARPKKRGGAWMDECVGRMSIGEQRHLPIAYLVCNFMPPSANRAGVEKNGADRPSLLTHSEVVTAFHEFGHGLHHMMTRINFPSVAGINGVPWDAVELPSQFMENFAWRPEVLPLISAHVDTGEALPTAELKRLLGSRTFQAGMQNVRQLEFALFDLRIHAEYDPSQGNRVPQILSEVRESIAVIKVPSFNRFAQSFSHIFSGGYAAGYYSYKWAEVLAADAFAAFEEQGVFDRDTAQRFLTAILEKGGSSDAMQAFVEFRGRKPQIAALLKQLGLAA